MANDNTLIRVNKGRKQRPFTAIDNEPINNKALSWKAKGLLLYLMSKPENWEVKVWQLKQASTDRRDSTEAGLKELIANGYIQRTRLQDTKGRFCGYEYLVSDIAIFETEAQENPQGKESENGKAVNGETDKTSGKAVNGETDKISGKAVNGETVTNKNIYSNEKNTDLKSVCDEPENTHTPFFENSQTNTQDSAQASPKATQYHTFDKSHYSNFENFKNLLITLNFAQVDAEHYFKKISAFCKSKGTKSKDFSAYVELWLTDDQTAGKLKVSALTQQASKTVGKTTTEYTPTQTITQKLDDMEAYAFKSGKATRQWCESAIQTLLQLFPQASLEEQQRMDLLGYDINELMQTLPTDLPPTANKRKTKKSE